MKKYFGLLVFFLAISSAISAQNKLTHLVSKGETLYSISRTLDVTVEELKAWNNLENNVLSIGQKIFYYKMDELSIKVISPKDEGLSLISISTPQNNEYYIVKSGDNLTSISRKHSMTLAEIRELNNLSSDFLRVGQQLTVRKIKDSVGPSALEYFNDNTPQGNFVIYTVQPNETAKELLNRFKMSSSELQQLNPEINIHTLKAKQRITVLLPSTGEFKNPYLLDSALQDLGLFNAIAYNLEDIGKTTTSGELYNPNKLTAAHSNIAIGSILFIENPENGNGIYVRINDRIIESGLKLSNSAFNALNFSYLNNSKVKIYSEI